jgi:branched-chain amino acid transport system ATP-binding protein
MNGLETQQLCVAYGEFLAIDRVSIAVPEGATVAIIGPNGAGKSTLLKCLAGWLAPRSGAITFRGQSLSGLSAPEFVRRGISLVPEGRRLFPSLSVEENLLMGCNSGRSGPWSLDRIFSLFPVLKERRHSPGTLLSGGQQQMVAIGRSLMSNPALLLCDELSLGLAPVVVGDIYAMLPAIRNEGVSVILVEQDVARARSVSSHLYCLQKGSVDLDGAPASLTLEAITAAYFGARA